MSLLGVAAFVQLITPSGWENFSSYPAAAAIVGLCGFAIMIRAWWLFKVRDTAICPIAKTTALISDDVYRLTRNPMYLGIVMMLLAVALFAGKTSYYAAAIAFLAIIDRSFCRYEESKLQAEFGDEFTQYKKTARRWI